MSLELEIGDFLKDVENSGVEELIADELDKLEYYLDQCGQALADINRTPVVEDAVYDRLCDILYSVRPDAPILQKVWSEDVSDVDTNVDIQLIKHPMYSIRTIKELTTEDLLWFIKNLPDFADYYAAFKLNGHGIRVVLNDGKVVKATSRGRSTLGRDLTQQVKWIIGDTIDRLCGYGIVELRGELVLPFTNLERARAYNPTIKSAFSGVSSMSRDSASEEEVALLRIVFYNLHSDGLFFDTTTEMYSFLENDCGLEVPLYWELKDMRKEDIEAELYNLLDNAEEAYTNEDSPYDIYTDGIVFGLDDFTVCEEIDSTGDNEFSDKYLLRNCALKVGYWKQDLYEGVIDHIVWSSGKTKVTPVAVLEEPVLTSTGNCVQNVPLYGANYILMLGAYPGRIINFRYGGEAGVVTCTPAGIPLAQAHIQYKVDEDFEVEGYDY